MPFFNVFRAPTVLWPAACLSACLCACSPSLNWRETRIDEAGLMALFPCRPDQLTRLVPIAGAMVDLHLTACDAGGASFAVSHAEFANGPAAQAGLAQWRQATLANLSAKTATELPMDFQLPGAAPGDTQVTLTKVDGKRGDGSAVNFNGVWLLREKRVIHAAIYAPTVTAEMSETFFPGLKFQ